MKEMDEVYRLYASDVYLYCIKLCGNETTAQDIVSETFCKAVLSVESFRGECSMKTWLCSIATNVWRSMQRKNKELPLDEEADISSNVSIERLTEDRDSAQRLHAMLHNLHEPYKEVFSLHVFAELRFADIGAVFGRSETWARVTFFRAKEKLINMMGETKV